MSGRKSPPTPDEKKTTVTQPKTLNLPELFTLFEGSESTPIELIETQLPTFTAKNAIEAKIPGWDEKVDFKADEPKWLSGYLFGQIIRPTKESGADNLIYISDTENNRQFCLPHKDALFLYPGWSDVIFVSASSKEVVIWGKQFKPRSTKPLDFELTAQDIMKPRPDGKYFAIFRPNENELWLFDLYGSKKEKNKIGQGDTDGIATHKNIFFTDLNHILFLHTPHYGASSELYAAAIELYRIDFYADQWLDPQKMVGKIDGLGHMAISPSSTGHIFSSLSSNPHDINKSNPHDRREFQSTVTVCDYTPNSKHPKGDFGYASVDYTINGYRSETTITNGFIPTTINKLLGMVYKLQRMYEHPLIHKKLVNIIHFSPDDHYWFLNVNNELYVYDYHQEKMINPKMSFPKQFIFPTLNRFACFDPALGVMLQPVENQLALIEAVTNTLNPFLADTWSPFTRRETAINITLAYAFAGIFHPKVNELEKPSYREEVAAHSKEIIQLIKILRQEREKPDAAPGTSTKLLEAQNDLAALKWLEQLDIDLRQHYSVSVKKILDTSPISDNLRKLLSKCPELDKPKKLSPR